MYKNDLDKISQELQKKIDDDEEQTYSPVVIKEYRNPTNFGILKHPDTVGEIKGPCGDTMKISLKIRNQKIEDARFWTDGCGATLACGNMLMKKIKRKTLLEAMSISPKELLQMLGGLPETHTHCATLSVNTLHKAIIMYLNRKGMLKGELV